MSDKRDKTFHVAFTEEEKDKVKNYAKDYSMTSSEFIRQAVFEKIRKIEHPELFTTQIPMNSEELQKIYKTQIEIKKLVTNNVKHGETIQSNMKALRERVNGEQIKLYKQRILDILKQHGKLIPEEIEQYTDIEIDDILKTLAKLQETKKVKLELNTGKWFINE